VRRALAGREKRSCGPRQRDARDWAKASLGLARPRHNRKRNARRYRAALLAAALFEFGKSLDQR
jgi:hypothetical protein